MTGERGATAHPPSFGTPLKSRPTEAQSAPLPQGNDRAEDCTLQGGAFSSGTVHPPSASCRTKFTECPVAISKHVYSHCDSNGPRLMQYKGIIMRRIAFANAGYRLQNQAPPICKIGVCETSPYSAFYLEIPT